jgi:hypothetical protein
LIFLKRGRISKDRPLDKKAKKRIEVLRTRLSKSQQQLAGAKKQMDEPAEVSRLEKEIAEINAELEKLKSS